MSVGKNICCSKHRILVLAFLLLLILAPLTIDVFSAFLAFVVACSINQDQIQTAAILPEAVAAAPSGPVKLDIPQHRTLRGLSSLAHWLNISNTAVNYHCDGADSDGEEHFTVTVQTSCTSRPVIVLPLPAKVPGLNIPFSFSVSGRGAVQNEAVRDYVPASDWSAT